MLIFLEGLEEHREDLEGPEEDCDDPEGLEELGENLEGLEDTGDTRGAAPVPASAQARPEHSLEEDSFKTLTISSQTNSLRNSLAC